MTDTFDKELYWKRRKQGLRGQVDIVAKPAKESNPKSRAALRRKGYRNGNDIHTNYKPLKVRD